MKMTLHEITEIELTDALDMSAAMARRMAANASELDELQSVARYAVVIAAQRFDRSRDVKFTSQAFPWVRKYLLLSVKQMRSPVSYPVAQEFRQFFALDIADFVDVLLAPSGGSESFKMADEEIMDIVEKTLSALDPQDEKILRLRYIECRDLRSVGREFGKSAEWARQKCGKALDAARKASKRYL